jgi:methionine synthase II (cobalamin-independent)
MVIISKDDDLSFLKEQATTGTGIRMSNNPPVVISVPSPTTIAYKGDNITNLHQQQQQQLQKQLQQQLNQSFVNNNAKNNNNTLINNNTLQIQPQQQQQPSAQQQQQQQQPQVAKAILLCRPQSHPFNVSLSIR